LLVFKINVLQLLKMMFRNNVAITIIHGGILANISWKHYPTFKPAYMRSITDKK